MSSRGQAEVAFERVGRPGSSHRVRVRAHDGTSIRSRVDSVATEEPLEIRLDDGSRTVTAAVTMRTPGNDFELAAGWLYSEGIVGARSEVEKMAYCVDRSIGEEQRYNIVNVRVRSAQAVDLQGLKRHFFTTSACGVCGKAGIERLQLRDLPPLSDGPALDPDMVGTLPKSLREAQGVFEKTGGLHAAGLFDANGNLIGLREDVGRHNALDKLIGWSLLQDRLPLADHVVTVSGRTSFELAQKCAAAGAPVLAAVSAPSSLAIEVAESFGMTLLGFVRGDRFNIYAGQERISPSK
jgi:FdhD protein